VLNYRRPYLAQGGDWGSAIASWLAFDHPATREKDDWTSGVRALHLNMMVLRPGIDERARPPSPEEGRWLAEVRRDRAATTGYQRIQTTKPQTLGVALHDSPVGLAAWIVEKFHGWSDRAGKAQPPFPLDTLLDNIMVYWLTGTAATSTWLYRGVVEERSIALPEGQRVEVPTAFAAFPADLAPPPPAAWIERAYDLRRHTPMPRGGHFAALEAPDLLVEDIRAFSRPLRFGAAND